MGVLDTAHAKVSVSSISYDDNSGTIKLEVTISISIFIILLLLGFMINILFPQLKEHIFGCIPPRFRSLIAIILLPTAILILAIIRPELLRTFNFMRRARQLNEAEIQLGRLRDRATTIEVDDDSASYHTAQSEF